MSYFFRRSAKIGPFRLNFSKSGIGASVGVKGARLTMTPRGATYITVGRRGFYYRESLSNGGPRPAGSPQSVVVPVTSHPSDGIVTADASDLVDSSSEALIAGLNARAKMFNPAWVVYLIASVLFVAGLTVSSTAWELPALTGPTADRVSNTVDEYPLLLARFGQPTSIISSEPFGIVHVRTAFYSPVHTKVVLVPNGCVTAYQLARQIQTDTSQPQTKKRTATEYSTPCVPSPTAGWTIVGYIDSAEKWDISADRAAARLDGITVKLTVPPTVEVEAPQLAKQKGNPQRSGKKEPPPKLEPLGTGTETQARQAAESAERWATVTRYAVFLGSLGLWVMGAVFHRKNAEKRTSRLFYELDDAERQKFAVVDQALSHLGQSHMLWRVQSQSANSDWKRNAGASSLLQRSQISVGLSNPPRVQTNIASRCVDLRSAKLYFLPDVILYCEHGTYGAIGYDDFQVEQGLSRFIEDGYVPADATIVDRTWRYVNKNGGPDRRFNNNAQLPIAQYGVLVLTSSRGLNLRLQTSSAKASAAFATCWRELRGRGTRPEPQVGYERPGNVVPPVPDAEEQAYTILGLNSTASTSEISAAYHQLAQMYHPDKVAGLASEFQVLADKRMREINAAYGLLKGRRTSTGTL